MSLPLSPQGNLRRRIRGIFDILDAHFGDLHWWPGETAFEVIVGAILTQNTAWRNVTIAIGRLKEEGLLTPEGLRGIAPEDLAALIRPTGYFNVKTRRLKAFIHWLWDGYAGDLERMFTGDPWMLRKELLAIPGIGEETADSILLYGGGKPVFVVDAYTRRILGRHGLIHGRERYGDIQGLFLQNLPAQPALFNQYHALLVETGKNFCRPGNGHCPDCPLRNLDGAIPAPVGRADAVTRRGNRNP